MTARRIEQFLVAALLAGLAPVGIADEPFTQVPEMERPPGIEYQSKAERKALEQEAGGRRGLEVLEQHVRALWPQVREVDLVALSKYQVDTTRGYRLPEEPGDFHGQAIAWNAEDGLWYLELRGPRLPARYDIVFRYLYFYASYDPATEKLGKPVVTIRGWVEE